MANLIFTTILITISSFFLSHSAVDCKLSFSVDYIHHDSPLSPYYNSSQTPYKRLRASAWRGVASTDRFRLSSKSNDLDIVSRMYPANVEYLMSISIGTPPFKILAIADTGSDLIWTQCKPCLGCYRQDQPMFDPSGSSTYDEEVTCDARSCIASNFGCDSDHKCRYSYHYSDGSFTNGVVATDTITFDSSSGDKVPMENINIGCTHETGGTFNAYEGGLIGLSRGPLSLISQLGDQIDNKFSYCLVPLSASMASSTFTFGSSTKAPPDSNVVKVPIIQSRMFYKVDLESIKVANTIVPMVHDYGTNGNTIIDSGTTLTVLPNSVLDGLISIISEVVTLPIVVDPEGMFRLCFNVDGGSSDSLILPDLELNFGNNAVVTLPPLNTFLNISESILCLAMKSHDDMSIIGNIAQQNFLIEYDVGNKELSFAPMDCTKY